MKRSKKSHAAEEKELQRQLDKMREESRQQQEKLRQENAHEDEESISFRERLDIIRKKSDSQDADSGQGMLHIDIDNREDEVLLEAPLPVTMASEYLPIEWIHNGIIKTSFDTYVKIMEVMPTNFLLKGDAEQANVIYSFAKFIKAGPDNFQFKTLAKKTDLSRYLKKIEEEIAVEKDEKCKELQHDYERLLMTVGSREAVSRRFFLIMKYQKVNARKADEAEAENQLKIMEERAINYLQKCENKVLIMDNPTDGTARILYDILNRTCNSSTDYVERLQYVNMFYEMKYGKKSIGHIPVCEYFAPREIDTSHASYMRMDDTYYDYMFISSKGYPVETYGGWMSAMINAGEGIDVDILAFKQNRARMIDTIGRKLRLSMPRLQSLSSATAEWSELENALGSGYYMQKEMVNNHEDLYYLVTMITVTAGNLKELRAKKDELIEYLKTREIYTIHCNMMHEQAFKTYLPVVEVDKAFYDRTKRNILTQGLAGCYPFTSFEMSDDDGILLGVNEINDSFVIPDFFNRKIFKNANISIVGTSGAGKTYLLQLIATRLRRKQIQTFIIAPDKAHEFARACKRIGGEFITLSASSNQCINVMEIRKRDISVSKILDDGMEEQSELALKIDSLHTFFELLIPDITDEEDQLLDEALMQVYKKKGITHNNESLFREDGSDEYKEMPVLGDVYFELNGRPSTQRIANILNRLVHGSASSFNQQTNVDLDNLYTVIDISKLGKLLPVGMYIALDYVYSKAKENRTKRKAIIIDEVWELIGSKSNIKAAEFVLEIFKIIRGYGGSAICATQDLNDFFALEDGKYGKGIINNSKTKIVLNLEKKEAETVRELLDLSEEEYDSILHFESGHGLLCANNSNLMVDFRASDMEDELITTDRKQLEELADAG